MDRTRRAALILAALALALNAWGAFGPTPFNWGFHAWGYLPRPLFFGLGALALLTFVPPLRQALARALDPLARALAGPSARGVAGAFVGLALLAFWFGRERIYLLSDGQLLVRSVQQGAVAFTADTLSAALQLYMSHLLRNILHVESATASFRLISMGAGALWLVALFATVGRLTRDGWSRLLLGGLLLLAGLTKLFYGYVETSPILAAAVAFYIWAAVRLVQERRGVVLATLAYLLVAAVHITGLTLFPSFLFLLWYWSAGDAARRPRAIGLLLLPIAAYLVYWLIKGGSVQRVQGAYAPYFAQFIPLVGPITAKQPYTLLSPLRWLDLFNEQFLLGPFALVALPVMAWAGGRRAWGTPVARFLFAALLPLLLLALVFVRYLGGARDWDLFANLAVPSLLLVGLALIDDAPAAGAAGAGAAPAANAPPEPERRAARRAPAAPGGLAPLAVTLLAVALLHVVGVVLIDARPADSLRRFDTLLSDEAPSSRWAKAYALVDLSNYYLDRGEPAQAIPVLERATRLDPASSFAAGSLGALYMDAGRLPEALPMMRRAARLRPDVAMNQYNLAGVLARTGQLDSALIAYGQSIRLNDHFLQAYQNMGLVLVARGRRAAADSIWREGLKYFPNDVGLYNNIGANLEAAGQAERAIEAYRAALKQQPSDGNALFNLSRLLQSLDRPAEAQPLLEQLVNLEPRNGEASVNLGLIYEGQGRVEDAMKAYSHAMAVNPKLPPAYLNLARLMIGRKDEPGAIQVLEAFLEADSADAQKVGVAQFLANVRRKAAAAGGAPADSLPGGGGPGPGTPNTPR